MSGRLYIARSYFFYGFEQWSWYLIPPQLAVGDLSQGSTSPTLAREEGSRKKGSIQFCLVLARLSLKLSKCSRICSRVSWASLLLELLRLHGKAESQILSALPAPLPRSEAVLSDTMLARTQQGVRSAVGLRPGGPACHMSSDQTHHPWAAVTAHCPAMTRWATQGGAGPTSASCGEGCCF